MHWTPVLSSFMLRRFHDLVGQGVKIDKGFKEVHVRQVSQLLSEFAGVNVSTQQIYNHLRKWRQRWVKIVRLKDLSGALWNEEHHMIVLDDENINVHTKVRYLLVVTSILASLVLTYI
jgi:methionine salvage enolase-phosphatase E1